MLSRAVVKQLRAKDINVCEQVFACSFSFSNFSDEIPSNCGVLPTRLAISSEEK